MSDLWEGTEAAPTIKPPPSDLNAERMLLATIFAPGNDAEALIASDEVMPEWFHDPRHKLIFEAGCRVVMAGTEVSVVAINNELGKDSQKIGGFTWIVELFRDMDADDWRPFSKIVRSKFEARSALLGLDRARMQIEGDGWVGTSLDQLRGLADALAPQETPIRNYAELFETMEAGNGSLPIDRANNLPLFGVDPLDRSIGAMAGTLGVIAAKTSAGKSSLAYQICVKSALRGRRVLLVSLEADREEVAAAFAANINESNRGQLLRRGVENISVAGVVKSNILGYHAGSGSTWDQIERATRAEHRKSPFSVVIIDYFTLLEPPNYKGNRNMASLYGEISKGGKRMAQQLGCSVIFISQFNRGVEDGQEPFLENLRETGQLEQDADWVVLMWAKAEDEPEGFRYVNAKIAKNRKGKRGEKFRMKLFPAEARFIESDTEVETKAPRRRA